jgi:hypothetical protein
MAWCAAAETARGPGGNDVRRGLKHFAPGSKVWVLPTEKVVAWWNTVHTAQAEVRQPRQCGDLIAALAVLATTTPATTTKRARSPPFSARCAPSLRISDCLGPTSTISTTSDGAKSPPGNRSRLAGQSTPQWSKLSHRLTTAILRHWRQSGR